MYSHSSQALNRTTNLAATLDIIPEEELDILHSDVGVIISRHHAGGGPLRIVTHRGLREGAIEEFNGYLIRTNEGIYGRTQEVEELLNYQIESLLQAARVLSQPRRSRCGQSRRPLVPLIPGLYL